MYVQLLAFTIIKNNNNALNTEPHNKPLKTFLTVFIFVMAVLKFEEESNKVT